MTDTNVRCPAKHHFCATVYAGTVSAPILKTEFLSSTFMINLEKNNLLETLEKVESSDFLIQHVLCSDRRCNKWKFLHNFT